MGKQKQAGGGHRNCTGANYTHAYLLNPKSHCDFGQGHPYLQEPRWCLPPAHYLINTLQYKVEIFSRAADLAASVWSQ